MSFFAGFWSPFHGQTCTTSNAVAVGTYLGVTRSIRTLLLHNMITKSNMENAFFPPVEDDGTEIFDETGIDSLMKLAKSSMLCPVSLKDYTSILIQDRLELLIGTSKRSTSYYEVLTDMIQYIVSCAIQAYDIVICDINAGRGDISLKALELVDLVVVNLNQNMEVLRTYFHRKEWHPLLDNKPHILVLGNYDADSKYNVKFIKRTFGYDKEIYTIPRHLPFMEAHNNHDMLKFFMSNINAQKNNTHIDFMYNVGLICKSILEYAKIDTENTLNPLERPTLFDFLLKAFK